MRAKLKSDKKCRKKNFFLNNKFLIEFAMNNLKIRILFHAQLQTIFVTKIINKSYSRRRVFVQSVHKKENKSQW